LDINYQYVVAFTYLVVLLQDNFCVHSAVTFNEMLCVLIDYFLARTINLPKSCLQK